MILFFYWNIFCSHRAEQSYLFFKTFTYYTARNKYYIFYHSFFFSTGIQPTLVTELMIFSIIFSLFFSLKSPATANMSRKEIFLWLRQVKRWYANLKSEGLCCSKLLKNASAFIRRKPTRVDSFIWKCVELRSWFLLAWLCRKADESNRGSLHFEQEKRKSFFFASYVWCGFV